MSKRGHELTITPTQGKQRRSSRVKKRELYRDAEGRVYTITTVFDGGVATQQWQERDGIRHGFYHGFHRNGARNCTQWYVDGELDGAQVGYDDWGKDSVEDLDVYKHGLLAKQIPVSELMVDLWIASHPFSYDEAKQYKAMIDCIYSGSLS